MPRLWKPICVNCPDEMPTPSAHSGIKDNHNCGVAANLEHQINQQVYALCGLTPEKTEIVEGAGK